MSDIPTSIDLDASSQTARRLRYAQVRGVNTIDYATEIHTLYAGADIPAAISGTAWSDPLGVQGYDAVNLFVAFTAGGTPRNLTINVQGAYDKYGTYFNRALSFGVATGDATAIPNGSHPMWAHGTGNFVIRLDTFSHYMRFQPILNGASTGSRITIVGQRVMLST
tara:strand:+ start:1321 stop:1818 length:498 start_codon:yes stop_codon:yes gene_type:complete